MLKPLNIKVRSLRDIQNDFPTKDFSSLSCIEESGSDFQSNAWIKAEAYWQATGCISLADDSGLVVDALGGEPGVYSARYGGPDLDDKGRNSLLLKKLEGIPFEKRTARFICVLALCMSEKAEESYFFEGSCEGYITEEVRGGNGFGYDPVFFDPELKQSFAQIKSEKKNERSHRFYAIKKFISYLYEN